MVGIVPVTMAQKPYPTDTPEDELPTASDSEKLLIALETKQTLDVVVEYEEGPTVITVSGHEYWLGYVARKVDGCEGAELAHHEAIYDSPYEVGEFSATVVVADD